MNSLDAVSGQFGGLVPILQVTWDRYNFDIPWVPRKRLPQGASDVVTPLPHAEHHRTMAGTHFPSR